MKIAQIAPLYEAVPPKLYGGTERVVAHLCDALVDQGHETVLFSSADARTRAELAPVRDQAIRLDPAPLKSDLASHLYMLSEVRRRAHEFDVLHFHVDMIHFPFFEEIAERTLTTLHGRLDLKDLAKVYADLGSRLVVKPQMIEVTALFAGGGILLLALGAIASLAWLGRLP